MSRVGGERPLQRERPLRTWDASAETRLTRKPQPGDDDAVNKHFGEQSKLGPAVGTALPGWWWWGWGAVEQRCWPARGQACCVPGSGVSEHTGKPPAI